MESLLSDVRYAWRLLSRSPGFALAAALTLGLGLGACTVMFSVLNTVLLRPLPYPQADRLVQVWETDPRRGDLHGPVSAYNFLEWRKHNQSFSEIATYDYNSVVLRGLKAPHRLSAKFVSTGFFDVLQAHAFHGRTFLPGEDAPGRARVAVISYRAWSRYFDRDPKIVERSIILDEQAYRVIGVMPAGFAFLDEATEVWCLPGFDARVATRGHHGLFAIGRLKVDASLKQAQAEMNTIAEDLNRQDGRSEGVRLVGLQDEIVGPVRRRLLVLWAASLIVLSITCANVAGLLLARAVSRRREVAIRTALGCSRARLIRQFLTESVFLASFGGLFGIAMSYVATRFLILNSGVHVPRLANLQMDRWVVGFSALACVATSLAFGIAPALQALRIDVYASLKESGALIPASNRLSLRSVLVTAEVGLATVLLVSIGQDSLASSASRSRLPAGESLEFPLLCARRKL